MTQGITNDRSNTWIGPLALLTGVTANFLGRKWTNDLIKRNQSEIEKICQVSLTKNQFRELTKSVEYAPTSYDRHNLAPFIFGGLTGLVLVYIGSLVSAVYNFENGIKFLKKHPLAILPLGPIPITEYVIWSINVLFRKIIYVPSDLSSRHPLCDAARRLAQTAPELRFDYHPQTTLTRAWGDVTYKSVLVLALGALAVTAADIYATANGMFLGAFTASDDDNRMIDPSFAPDS